MTGAAATTVELLARRAELVRTLRAGPLAKRDLVEHLSISRSTVDRAVRNLESNGLLERNEEISLTLRGRLAIDAYDEFVEYVASLESASQILAALPEDTDVERPLVEGATFVSPDRMTPQRPAVAFLDEVERATEIRGFGSALMPTYVDRLHERLVGGELHLEMVLSPSLFDELLSEHAEQVTEALETGRVTLLEATETLEYSLLVLEQPERTLVAALVYDDMGRSSVVFNDAPAAVRWAERTYEELHSAADPLPLQ